MNQTCRPSHGGYSKIQGTSLIFNLSLTTYTTSPGQILKSRDLHFFSVCVSMCFVCMYMCVFNSFPTSEIVPALLGDAQTPPRTFAVYSHSYGLSSLSMLPVFLLSTTSLFTSLLTHPNQDWAPACLSQRYLLLGNKGYLPPSEQLTAMGERETQCLPEVTALTDTSARSTGSVAT